VGSLPPTQYLIVETLAARHRLGEPFWTFPTRLLSVVRALAAIGLVWHRPAPTPSAVQVGLTAAGRAAVLDAGYRPPVAGRPGPTPAEVLTAARVLDELEHYVAVDSVHVAGLVLAAVLPGHDARVRAALAPEILEQAEHRWRVSTTEILGCGLDVELRIHIATAVIQSGYEDQDDDDPASWDLVDSTPCDGCPSPDRRRCACSGRPWVHDRLWTILGPVLAAHTARVRAEERAQVAERIRREVAEQIAAAIESAELPVGALSQRQADCAVIARQHATEEDPVMSYFTPCEHPIHSRHMPTIVVLCGSTRFSDAFREANLRETIAGRIVLSIGCDLRSDGELWPDPAERERIKVELDELHKRKIDLANQVLVLNVGGYVGESTRAEIDYARSLDKPIRYLEEHADG
jgi:hypothetical protein